MSDSVKVAVRCRPFNQREKDRGAKCIIEMEGSTTKITDPATGEVKPFAFDYSYWSHDRNDEHFANQTTVFNDLGVGVLENAWQGYNVSLFAYGQTGSGKSYSMVGYGEDKGIIPLACEEIFKRIEANPDSNITFKVEASMMEIYNERVRDLFNPKNKANEGAGLKVRENPKTGPYVDGLALLAVRDYEHISRLMDEGTQARTVASTNMNATSSRAHTIFQILFTQTQVNAETMKATDKVSRINLVDLAGSERAQSTGAEGARLKEGAAINKSLSALGNCISALADLSTGKKKVFVPYRDSVLTWLLKESLGGNARTIMIAALSPADINYEETLSTLRYADRAKQIKNAAVVNEDPNEKLIRELREEVERLRAQHSAGGGGGGGGDEETKKELEEYRRKMMESEELIRQLNKSWEEKLKETAALDKMRASALEDLGIVVATEADLERPQLVNVNEDPAKTGTIKFYLKEGTMRVGRADAPIAQDIRLGGLSIVKEHATLECNDQREVFLTSLQGAKTFVNGQLLSSDAHQLHHGDRIIFGNNHIFQMLDPKELAKLEAEREEFIATHPEEPPPPPVPAIVDFDVAQKEWAMANAQGVPMMDGGAEEMEKKVKEMEEKLRMQFDEAAARLEAQRKEYEEKEKQLQVAREQQQETMMKKVQAEGGDVDGKLKELQEKIEKEKEDAMALHLQQVREFEERQRLLEEELTRQKEIAEQAVQDAKMKKIRHEAHQEQILNLIPMLREASDMSRELSKNISFELKLVSKIHLNIHVDETTAHEPEIAVKVMDNDSGLNRLWSEAKFIERLYLMRDYYNMAQFREMNESEEIEDEEDDNDPFFDDEDDQVIGHAQVYLEALYFLVDISCQCPILDYKGKVEGELSVEIQLLNEDKEPFVGLDNLPPENVDDAVVADKRAKVRIVIQGARGLPGQLATYHVRYQFFKDKDTYQTERARRTDPIRYEKLLPIVVTSEFRKYLSVGVLSFEVCGEVGELELQRKQERRLSVALQSRKAAAATNAVLELEEQLEAKRLEAEEALRLEAERREQLNAGRVGTIMEEEELPEDDFASSIIVPTPKGNASNNGLVNGGGGGDGAASPAVTAAPAVGVDSGKKGNDGSNANGDSKGDNKNNNNGGGVDVQKMVEEERNKIESEMKSKMEAMEEEKKKQLEVLDHEREQKEERLKQQEAETERLRKEREELMATAAAFKAEQDRLLKETERIKKEQDEALAAAKRSLEEELQQKAKQEEEMREKLKKEQEAKNELEEQKKAAEEKRLALEEEKKKLESRQQELEKMLEEAQKKKSAVCTIQ